MVLVKGFPKVGKNAGKPIRYKNEDQRNVHIWSLFQPHDECRDLVAGFYNHEGAGSVTYRMLYEWLALIIEPREADDSNSKPTRGVPEGTQLGFGLARLEDVLNVKKELDPQSERELDPRWEGIFPPANTTMKNRLINNWIRRNKEERCIPGHYLIFYGSFRGTSGTKEEILIDPQLTMSPTFESSILSVAGSKSASDNERSASLRKTVRTRDRECLITQTEPMRRSRGIDYTGFEVAHIFPIAWAGDTSILAYLTDSEGNGVNRQVRSMVTTRQEGDRARNAFLLRADIHRLFDQYVWSIYENKIRIFEKEVPHSMTPERSNCLQRAFENFVSTTSVDLSHLQNIRPSSDGDSSGDFVPKEVLSEPPHATLMLFHFICALHKHFVGIGHTAKSR